MCAGLLAVLLSPGAFAQPPSAEDDIFKDDLDAPTPQSPASAPRPASSPSAPAPKATTDADVEAALGGGTVAKPPTPTTPKTEARPPPPRAEWPAPVGPSPAELQRGFAQAAQAAIAAKDARALTKSVKSWLLACGPTGVDACRRQALASLPTVGFSKAARRPINALAKGVSTADACLVKAEASHGHAAPPCLGAALSAYRRDKDLLMVTRALEAQALDVREAKDAVTLHKLQNAARTCPEERCRALRARILHAAMPLFERTQDFEGVATFALDQLQLLARKGTGTTPLPRPRELAGICQALEAKAGNGRCHVLEKRILGRYTFVDYSEEPPRTEGLTSSVVQQVSAHYGVLVTDCLAREARDAPARADSDVVRYGVHWTVHNNGQAGDLRMERHDLAGSPLEHCLADAISYFRYPRYRGELQHVDQEFQISVSHRP
jgi:hypothetical protein